MIEIIVTQVSRFDTLRACEKWGLGVMGAGSCRAVRSRGSNVCHVLRNPSIADRKPALLSAQIDAYDRRVDRTGGA